MRYFPTSAFLCCKAINQGYNYSCKGLRNYTTIKEGLSMKYTIESFGRYEGVQYDEIFVEHDGVTISFSNFGARINRWLVPNSKGEQKSIILGYDNVEHAVFGKGYYYGAMIAPIAGRINLGKFTIDNQLFELDINDGNNHLHGGDKAVDLQKWDYKIENTDKQFNITFTFSWPDGYNGYAGPIDMAVSYSYSTDHIWRIEYTANTEKKTIFNPTNHVYFNLNGDNEDNILNHTLQINADKFLAVKEDGLPVGTREDVEGTPFDLRQGQMLSNVLQSDHEQVAIKDGFDHPFYLNGKEPQAILSTEDISIECRTSSPAIVVYSSQVTDQAIDIWGHPIRKYGGITLETQIEPDAINHTDFNNIILEPQQTFSSWTEYQLKI